MTIERKPFSVAPYAAPDGEWFDSLKTALRCDEIKTQFTARFTDGKMQYRFQTAAETSKRQPDENIKSYRHRMKRLVDKGWPRLPDADANSQTACDVQRIGKYKDYFIRVLTTPRLKRIAHQVLVEDLSKTWDTLQTLILNKDTSLVISAEKSSFQQSISNSVTTDSRFTDIERTLNEISNMVKNHQVNGLMILITPK